jgi:HTH-type transcriptional regulator, competence development regulator
LKTFIWIKEKIRNKILHLTKFVKANPFKAIMATFGETIKKYREERQLPLRTVASYLDIDQAVLSKMEHNKRTATKEQVKKLAKYFEANEKTLLILWLSDKVIGEIKDEEFADDALKVAEQEIKYIKRKKRK